MPFDFKKEYKEFYMPKGKPEIVTYGKRVDFVNLDTLEPIAQILK